jgi:protein TonB
MPNRDPSRRALAALAGTLAALAAGAAWTAEPAPQEAIKPVWVQRPTMRDLMRVYPGEALDTARTGKVVIDCRVADDGTLTACAVEDPSRVKYGFGEAGLKLASHYRMAARDEDGRATAGAGVRLPILFKIPDDRVPERP